MTAKLELNLQKWNTYVSDETQCMQLSQDEEMAFLSSKDAQLVTYLKLHPEMAHELMVPAGFKQCLVRRYERYLGNQKPISVQNGAADEAKWDAEIFDAMLPGKPKVIANPKSEPEPSWREVNEFVCRNGVDTITGEAMAPHYEYVATGERVRVVRLGQMQIEVSAKEFLTMWSHKCCGFAASTIPEYVEFAALHGAFNEIFSIEKPWNDWQFPIGQQIAMLKKQLEHRLRAAHKDRPNPCSPCCPFRDGPGKKGFKEYLTKAQAASLVCDELFKKKEPTFAADYDPLIRAELEKAWYPL